MHQLSGVSHTPVLRAHWFLLCSSEQENSACWWHRVTPCVALSFPEHPVRWLKLHSGLSALCLANAVLSAVEIHLVWVEDGLTVMCCSSADG